MLLVPTNKMRILNPANKMPVPEEGIEIDRGSSHYHYWLRRLKCGDMEKSPAVANESPAAPQEAPAVKKSSKAKEDN